MSFGFILNFNYNTPTSQSLFKPGTGRWLRKKKGSAKPFVLVALKFSLILLRPAALTHRGKKGTVYTGLVLSRWQVTRAPSLLIKSVSKEKVKMNPNCHHQEFSPSITSSVHFHSQTCFQSHLWMNGEAISQNPKELRSQTKMFKKQGVTMMAPASALIAEMGSFTGGMTRVCFAPAAGTMVPLRVSSHTSWEPAMPSMSFHTVSTDCSCNPSWPGIWKATAIDNFKPHALRVHDNKVCWTEWLWRKILAFVVLPGHTGTSCFLNRSDSSRP